MAKYYLVDTYSKFVSETEWLLQEFNIAVDQLSIDSIDKSARLSAEMSVIRLHDAWARFCREIIVLSAGGRPYTANGNQLAPVSGIHGISEVIPVLLARYPRRRHRFEPKWARPREAIQAGQLLNIPNISTFGAAIGATNSPAEELRPIRNFLAHRGKNSANQIRNQYFFNGTDKVTVENVAGKLIPPGIRRFEKWVIDLRLIAIASIQ